MLTQWYDICGIIEGIFLGFTAMLTLVVYLEQWLARPDTPSLGALPERELAQQDDSGLGAGTPDPSVEAGASYLRRIKAPGFEPDPQAARLSLHLFTGLPANTGEQLRQ